MKELYFSDIWTICSTCMLVLLLLYVGRVFIQRKVKAHWNKRLYALMGIGLVLCCFVVMRDRYVESLQGGVGLFPLSSIQILFAYILAACIVFVGLFSIFIRKEKYQKIIFYVVTYVILLKVIVIEFSRILS